ncbi:MAG TPA: integration host factor subunit beta [Deltaproteobacteria bacterium]|nr:integration host factor subunit beta [Deltaproteobacteria bacterium]HCP47529.1 integration host factor subunit beta [Deltaproteobacteria bacterium]
MTKSELAQLLADSGCCVTRRHADRVVSTIFNSMGQALVDGDRIEIRGFGSFEVRSRPARKGRNPRTGQSVDISERKVPHFRAGKEIRKLINDAAGS